MEPRTTTLLQGIDTIIVRVSNLEASRSWYAQKLDLHPIWEAPNMPLTVLDPGGPVSLTLWQTDQPIRHNENTASYPIFKTGDAAALQQVLQDRGVRTGELVSDPYTISFFFSDPDAQNISNDAPHCGRPLGEETRLVLGIGLRACPS